ncbi:outer dense fiber protein 2-like [Carassius gibelio]|uniref:outer dense fiber protein 2-like n=1 Tax=Carassius gibelio TaxID=101364 RepID=UPI002277CD83|nr:outer dense fiber protein 2-like [Carassius gibelio]
MCSLIHKQRLVPYSSEKINNKLFFPTSTCHVKKSTKCSPTKTVQVKTKSSLHPTVNVKTRVPRIPHGKVSTREIPFKWEGPSHRLEITPPQEPERSQSPLRIEDLVPDEEETLHGLINQYERKIDSLVTEVNSLKNEMRIFFVIFIVILFFQRK